MRNKVTIMLMGLLFATVWGNALAQEQSLPTPAQRLQLTLVDNQSTYDIGQQQNAYRNILQLGQPEGDYKFTAGLLKQGDNYITISRQGDTEETATEFARVNLNANIVKREVEELSTLELTGTTVNAPWTANGLQSGSWGASGYYIRSGDQYYLTYTIPAGYDDGIIVLYIYTYNAGYFKINGTSYNSQTTAGGWNRYVLTGLSSGSQIKIQGCNSNGGNADSPRMGAAQVLWAPSSLVPTVNVTSTLSLKNGENWAAATSLGSAITYQPNDFVNVDALNVEITDVFSAPTADNSHPTSYSYMTDASVNIDWTSADMAGDFYACADYEHGDGTTAGIVLSGTNRWEYQFVGVKDDDIMCLWLPYYGQMLYTMPNTFAGTRVNVKITADTGTSSGGSILVNGEKHTFSPGDVFTWIIDVSANGTIRFTCDPDENYTLNISKVEIIGGNGASLKAPSYTVDPQDVPSILKPSSKIDVRQLPEKKQLCVTNKHID